MRTLPKTQCAGCRKFFTSTSEFDAHLTGGYGPNKPPRRCKTDEEMQSGGFIREQMAISGLQEPRNRDVWFRKAIIDRARRAFAK